MSAPPDCADAETRSGEADGDTDGRTAGRVASAAVTTLLIAALALTWWRLQRGTDLVDEAFSVLVPWRWALGDKPFVDEQDLSQAAGLIVYPFVKLYALAGGNDVTGLVLYDRYLYFALGLLVAACTYVLARRSLSRALAALVAAPFVAIVLFETPQLTANTLCALLLSAGAALGAVTVLGGRRRWAALSGAAFGLAGVAYPTVLLMTPFIAVFLAFSLGRRAVPMIARGSFLRPSPRETTASGPRAWRALSAWVFGGVIVVGPVVLTVLAVVGATNLGRCWDYTITLAHELDQLGGAPKAVEVAGSFVGLLVHQWYIVIAALVSLAVLRVRPRWGRWSLLLTPPALWLVGTTSGFGAAGAVILYALATPYLLCFVPPARREDGARLLLWIWAPALLVGAMTAYTSADGFVHAAVGLMPGVLCSGLFLAWGLGPPAAAREASASSRDRFDWAVAVGVGAVVLVALAFQVQFQIGGVHWSDLDARMQSGPWKGINVTAPQRRALERFATDLAREARPGDRLLIYPRGSAYYLYWPGEIAANTYQLSLPNAQAPLPKATVSYYRRHREVPTLVAHLTGTADTSAAHLRSDSGGLEYLPVLVAPGFALLRKPPGDSTAGVLARLPAL